MSEGASDRESNWNSLAAALAVGNILRTSWPDDDDGDWLNLYLGSGRCGACFDRWGLMNVAPRSGHVRGNNPTHLMHADNWNRDIHGLDTWLPVWRILWHDQPSETPTKYSQTLELSTGLLTTKTSSQNFQLSIKSAFDPFNRDLLGIAVEYAVNGGLPLGLVAISFPLTDDDSVVRNIDVKRGLNDKHCDVNYRCGTAEMSVKLKIIDEEGGCEWSPDPKGIRLEFTASTGRHLILIGTASEERAAELTDQLGQIHNVEMYFEQAALNWRLRYGNSFVHLPKPEHQALWARSLFYVLASYAPDVRAPAPPMGWAGLAWGRDFPQDLSYIHPALLRLGHLDIAKAWVEYFYVCRDTCRAFTKRVYGVDGIFWPWNLPMSPDAPLHIEETPIEFQYQIHNSAYPSRMAYETTRMLNDQRWSIEIAAPIIFDSATFFTSVLSREPNGTWGLRIKPASGQDELGMRNAPNYLCALFAAKYALQTAITIVEQWQITGIDTSPWQQILQDGLAFNSLRDPSTGTYSTNGSVTASEVAGRQKHPVQLGPLAFLPLGEIDAATEAAYRQRNSLCEVAGKPVQLWGWTLPAFWLAAVRRRDSVGLEEELGRATYILNVDPDWIQIFESSGRWYPFFVTSNGLYLQTVNDSFVSDYGGVMSFGNGIVSAWHTAQYENLRTFDGIYSRNDVDNQL